MAVFHPGSTFAAARGSRHAMACLLLAMATNASHAAELTLHGTGVGPTGTPLTGGAVDPHWQVVSGPGAGSPFSAVVLDNQHPNGNYFTAPDAMWISTTRSGLGTSDTTFTYQLQFDMTGFDPASAVISGLWGVDNQGAVYLNGLPAVGTGALTLNGEIWSNFNTQHAFSISSGFVQGLNALSFVVSDVQNPSGLNVGGLIGTAAAVPEGSTLALTALGLVFLALRLRPRN